MKCENLQFNLPLYFDDALSNDERESIDRHLPACPLCRHRLAEYLELRNELRSMALPMIPDNVLQSVRSAISSETEMPAIQIGTLKTESHWDRLRYWMMPYSVGTASALVLSFVLLSALLTTKSATDKLIIRNKSLDSPIILANSNANDVRDELTLPYEYTSVVLARDTPKVNPTGALFALTKTLIRGEMEDEEVVLVADVFGNGLARIAEVVEPPSSAKAMRELEKAFQTDPQKAPFLPPKIEGNSDAVRVVVKIQQVEVVDTSRRRKLRK